MELQITPEPTAEEAEAIRRALALLLLEKPADGRGAWWRQGLGEALAGAEGDTPNGHWNG